MGSSSAQAKRRAVMHTATDLARTSHGRPEQGRTMLPEQHKRTQPDSQSVEIGLSIGATEAPAGAAFARSGLPCREKSGLEECRRSLEQGA